MTREEVRQRMARIHDLARRLTAEADALDALLDGEDVTDVRHGQEIDAPIISQTVGETIADFEKHTGAALDREAVGALLGGIAAAVRDRTGQRLFAPTLRPTEEEK